MAILNLHSEKRKSKIKNKKIGAKGLSSTKGGILGAKWRHLIARELLEDQRGGASDPPSIAEHALVKTDLK